MSKTLHAGIDEAGLGPLLGPLCFGFTAFSAPPDCDLWAELEPMVARRGSRGIAVADSKRVYSGRHGLRRIEETALVFATILQGRFPASVGDFFSGSPLADVDNLWRRHPWYGRGEPMLPRRAERAKIEDAAGRLRERLRERGIELLAAASRAVPEGELNDSFRETLNKSATHFEKCGDAIAWIAQTHGAEGGELWVDHHGMRRRYAASLAALFPGNAICTEREEKERSVYRLECGKRTLRILFVERAEEKSFAVALASIFAKYSRELLMERWNEFFSRLAPGVRPTAGYFVDAQRYLREAGETIERAGIAKAQLVRER